MQVIVGQISDPELDGLTSILDVQVGDTIMDGKNRTKVVKIEHNACGSRDTHVNDKDCWGRHAFVRLSKDSPSVRNWNEDSEWDRTHPADDYLQRKYEREEASYKPSPEMRGPQIHSISLVNQNPFLPEGESGITVKPA